MGLAASQARFLGLTARKSNIEFQGQQINQQRTALSNEINNLYSDYNKLNVPVPPSVNEYQKTTYTVDSTYEDYQISSFTQILDGEYAGYYDVVLSYQKDLPKAYTYTAQNSVVTIEKNDKNEYSYINFQLGTESYTYDEKNPDASTVTKITGDYEKYQGLSTIMKAQELEDGVFYMYMRNGIAYYTSEDDLNKTEFEEKEGKIQYYGPYAFDYQGTQKKDETVQAKAALTQASSGRLSTIYFVDSEDKDLIGNTYSITTGTEDDQQAYDDALNEYYYEKELYEKEVHRINLKTESIQSEDRGLELKLNQLDTEQKAISTEMDTIKTIIKDNIDTVFKTFDG